MKHDLVLLNTKVRYVQYSTLNNVSPTPMALYSTLASHACSYTEHYINTVIHLLRRVLLEVNRITVNNY